jgi:hypothetical protein
MQSRVRLSTFPALRWSAAALLGGCAGILAAQPQSSAEQSLGEASSLSAPLTQRAHEHGLADLAIAQDGAQWWLELRVPLADLVGFERLPHNQTEAAAVLAAVRALAAQAMQLESGCTTQSVEARLEPGGSIDLERGEVPQAAAGAAAHTHDHHHKHDHNHDHKHKHHDGHTHDGHGHSDEQAQDSAHSGHVDLHLTRTHHCAPPGPSGLQLHWPAEAGTQPRVRAQWLLESGQGGTQMQATETQLRWRRND